MKWIFGLFFLWPCLAWSLNDLQTASQHKQWKSLLGYRYDSTSSIQSDSFFLSPEGHRDPLAELTATIAALQETSQADNTHAQCRFRGRYYWILEKGLVEPDTLPKVTCSEFQKFANFPDTNANRSISLIFATGYLGNPASYYGHLLLKLNTDSSTHQNSELDSIALNYGAKIPENENVVLYILKGLTGVYPSAFTQKEFYYHLNNYTDGELRDLWEYRLTLPQSAHELIVGHLWEMLGIQHKYYFANRNCA